MAGDGGAARPLLSSSWQQQDTVRRWDAPPGDGYRRCRTKNWVAASPADSGTPVCPPRLAISVFSAVEQLRGRLPVVAFVVPLQQHMQRDGDPASLLGHRARHETPGEQAGGHDAGFHHHRQSDAEEDHPSRVAARAVDPGQRQQGGEGGSPFRDRLVDEGKDEGADDLVADRLTGLQSPVQAAAGTFEGLPAGAIPASGKLDGGRGETRRRGVPGPSHQPGIHPGQPTGVTEQDQRCRFAADTGVRRKPGISPSSNPRSRTLPSRRCSEVNRMVVPFGSAAKRRSRTTYRPTKLAGTAVVRHRISAGPNGACTGRCGGTRKRLAAGCGVIAEVEPVRGAPHPTFRTSRRSCPACHRILM